VGSDRTVQIDLSEYRLNPQDLRAPAGILTIIVHNRGVIDHNLVLSHDGEVIDSIKPIGPGQTTEMILQLVPGKYSMASTVQSDQTLGEYGTLSVSGS
jgi:hypothetical protein